MLLQQQAEQPGFPAECQTARLYERSQPQSHQHEHPNLRQQVQQQHQREHHQRPSPMRINWVLRDRLQTTQTAAVPPVSAYALAVGFRSTKQPHMGQASCPCLFVFLYFPRYRPLLHRFFARSDCFAALPLIYSSSSRSINCNSIRTYLRSNRCTAVRVILCSSVLALCGHFASATRSASFSASASSRFRAPPGYSAARDKQKKLSNLQQLTPPLRQVKQPRQHIEYLGQQAREQLPMLRQEQQKACGRIFPVRKSPEVNVPAAILPWGTALFPCVPPTAGDHSAILTENWARGGFLTGSGGRWRTQISEPGIPDNSLECILEEVTRHRETGTERASDTSCTASTSSHACAGVLSKRGEGSAAKGREGNQQELKIMCVRKIKSNDPQRAQQQEEKQQEEQQEHTKERQPVEKQEQERQQEAQLSADLELVKRQQKEHLCSSEVNHCFCEVPWQEPKRIRLLAYVLRTWLLNPYPQEQGIVFCSCEQEAALLASHSLLSSFSKSLHAGLTQSTRSTTLRAFGKGVFAVLIGTDVTARELDLPRVRLVVHYGLPRTSEAYIRRTRRAGTPTRESMRLGASAGDTDTSVPVLSEESFDAREGWHHLLPQEKKNMKAKKSCSCPSSDVDSVDNCTGLDSNKSGVNDIDKMKRTAVLHDAQMNLWSSTINAHQRALFQREGVTPDGNAMPGSRNGLSVLLVDRGNRQHQALARHLARVLRIHFSEIELPSAEDMDQRYTDEIEHQLLSPAAVALGKALQPVAELQLQLHGARLLAAAFSLFLQQHHRMTWRSALSGRVSFTPVLFHDPRYQILRNKDDLLQLLDAILHPTTPPSGYCSRQTTGSSRSQNSTDKDSMNCYPNRNKEERSTLRRRVVGRRSGTGATENLSERLLALGRVGHIRRSSCGYVVDVSACTAKRILHSEIVRKYGIKVTYAAAALPLLVEDYRKRGVRRLASFH